ncbi:unnamed protein product, partial [Heterosigma akashiwo]
SINPALVRLLGIVMSFWTIVNCYGCMYMFNLRNGYFGESNWGQYLVYLQQDLEQTNASFLTAHALYYLEAMFFSASALSANDKEPQTAFEYLFALAGLLMSIGVNAVIIGSATTVLSNLDSTAVAHKKKVDAIQEYLRFRRVPNRIQKKILSYYEYCWLTGQSSHAEHLFHELPDKLRLELSTTLHRKLIEQVPLFKALSPAGVMILVHRLKPIIVLPYEVIIREGDGSDDGMYFINRGSVRCYTKDGHGNEHYIISLHEGNFFGEVALLEPGARRTANIRARSFCELRTLRLKDFQVVLHLFPDFKATVEKIAGRKQIT